MGILKAIGDFLLGKEPDIFDAQGQVLHKHPKKKWDAWQNKFKTDPQYNWRNHTGTQAGAHNKGQKRP
jgi:hypothetical protein